MAATTPSRPVVPISAPIGANIGTTRTDLRVAIVCSEGIVSRTLPLPAEHAGATAGPGAAAGPDTTAGPDTSAGPGTTSGPGTTAGPGTAAPTGRWRVLRAAAVTVWAIAFVAFCLRDGVPFDRANQTIWILTGLLAVSVGRPWRAAGRILLDWLPFVALLYLYDYSRGLAEGLGSTVQVAGPVEWERALFFGTVPTVWLQQHLYDPGYVHWWEAVGSVVYVSHFFLAWAIAAVLYARDRAHWYRWARAIVVLSFAGLVTFALMPAAPPWYASREGLLPPIERISTRGWSELGLHQAAELVHQGQAVVNDVAAIPSLHTGFAVLVAVWFWPRVPAGHRWWLRPLLVAYPIVMLATLVYAGEHYVVDGVIGALYVVGVLLALRTWDQLQAARSAVVDLTTGSADPRLRATDPGPALRD